MVSFVLLSEFSLELILVHDEILNTLYQADDARDARPASQQTGDTLTCFAHIEIVAADAAEKNAENTGSSFTFHDD